MLLFQHSRLFFRFLPRLIQMVNLINIQADLLLLQLFLEIQKVPGPLCLLQSAVTVLGG